MGEVYHCLLSVLHAVGGSCREMFGQVLERTQRLSLVYNNAETAFQEWDEGGNDV